MTGQELRKIREARGETQKQLAEVLNVWEHTVWRWENGRSPIKRPWDREIRALTAAPVLEKTA